jgi:hypothetical protein
MTAEASAPIENIEALKAQSKALKAQVEKARAETGDVENPSSPTKPLGGSKPTSMQDESSSKRGLMINTANLVGYAVNISTSYLGGVAGAFGKSNVELSYQYQTLITPSASYFGYIWGLIFLSQGFFVAAQLLPKYKDHVLVQKGVGFWYFFTCVAQSAWTVSFGFEFMATAFVAMVAILLCLMTILNRQWGVIDEHERNNESDPWLLANNAVSAFEEEKRESIAPPPSFAYWLLRFPFAVHAGWIAPATPLMLSVVMVYYKVDIQVELWTAVMGIAMLFGMSMGLLLRQDKGAPSYVFPAVVAYAFVGVAWELNSPSDAILGRFQEAEISLVKNVAGFCGGMLLVTAVSRFFAILLRDHCCPRRDSEEDEDVIYVEAEDCL